MKRNGTIYFTDTFSARLREKDPWTELQYVAVYMIKDGKVSVAAPGSTIWRYDVQPDDTATNGKVFIVDHLAGGETPGNDSGAGAIRKVEGKHF